MQQWLSLFTQCAVPIFKTLATVKSRESLSRLPSELTAELTRTQQMLSFLGISDEANKAEESESVLADMGQSAAVQTFVQTVNWAMQQRHLDFQQWRWRQEKALRQTLVAQHREVLFKLAAEQRKTALQLPEAHKILDHWPLRLFPSQLLDSLGLEEPIPLRIFMAPPTVQFERWVESAKSDQIPDLELRLAQHLRDFLNQSYGLHDPMRPTEFLGGAWESKRFHGEASIKALFNLLKSAPTLILESEIDGDRLNFRLAYWGVGQTRYTYRSLFKLPYRDFLQASAKARALHWRTVREKLMALGRSPDEIGELGGDNESNLALLKEAETLEEAGVILEEPPFRYRLNRQDWDRLAQLLAACHCLVAGWMADIHHWRHQAVSPILPLRLPQLTRAIDAPDLTRQLLEKTVELYSEILPASGVDGPGLAPELTLKLAHSLTHLSDPSFADIFIHASLQDWLAHRQRIPRAESLTTAAALAAMPSVLIPEDRPYCETLADCFAALGNDGAVQQAQDLLAEIKRLEAAQNLPQFSLRHTSQVAAGKILAVELNTQHCQVLVSQDNRQIQVWRAVKTPPESNPSVEHSPRLLKGHQGMVLTLAMSLDGQTMASSDRTQNRSYIKIWDLAAGKLKRTLPGHRKAIHALTLSADGGLLASGSHKIKLWRLCNGESFRTLFGHRQRVYALAAAPDAQTVISGSGDATVKIWSVRTGELQRTLTGHRGRVRSLAVSPDGQWVASGGEDHTLRLWDLAASKLRHSLKAHQGEVYALTISPDGRLLISGGADAALRIWDMQTGELLQTLTGHTAAVRALAIRPDGKTLASASEDGSLKLWQVS